MALKIFTGAKPSQKAGIKPFGITEIEMLPAFSVGKHLSYRSHFYSIQVVAN
jgi:hypothetical protein